MSDVRFKSEAVVEVDTGFLGIAEFYVNFVLPKKRSKKHSVK
jgi:hypothetical protein